MTDAPHRPHSAAADAPFGVLVVHNAYTQRGGEDAVVEAEVELLRRHGHEVTLYRRSNDDVEHMPRLDLAQQTLWSRRTTREMAELLGDTRPAVVHVHNTLPLVSPSVYWAARKAGVPVVQTLHNFRLLCPQALMLRDNRVCEDCLGHVPWRAVKYRCYRGSAAQSAMVATTVQVHRWLGTWQKAVTRYIALNEFCRDKFVAGGLPANRIRIKPNFIDLPAPANHQRGGFLFVGRLSVEKGVAALASALREMGSNCRLRVIGDGPEAHLLRGIDGVEMLGACQPEEVMAHMQTAEALILPSIWYENFPRTIVEAFANGLPVIASRIGAMISLIEDQRTGLHFEAGNASDLVAKLNWAATHTKAMQAMGHAARSHYEAHLTGDSNYAQLISIYTEALEEPASGIDSGSKK